MSYQGTYNLHGPVGGMTVSVVSQLVLVSCLASAVLAAISHHLPALWQELRSHLCPVYRHGSGQHDRCPGCTSAPLMQHGVLPAGGARKGAAGGEARAAGGSGAAAPAGPGGGQGGYRRSHGAAQVGCRAIHACAPTSAPISTPHPPSIKAARHSPLSPPHVFAGSSSGAMDMTCVCVS
jgi:hypothetical protein